MLNAVVFCSDGASVPRSALPSAGCGKPHTHHGPVARRIGGAGAFSIKGVFRIPAPQPGASAVHPPGVRRLPRRSQPRAILPRPNRVKQWQVMTGLGVREMQRDRKHIQASIRRVSAVPARLWTRLGHQGAISARPGQDRGPLYACKVLRRPQPLRSVPDRDGNGCDPACMPGCPCLPTGIIFGSFGGLPQTWNTGSVLHRRLSERAVNRILHSVKHSREGSRPCHAIWSGHQSP